MSDKTFAETYKEYRKMYEEMIWYLISWDYGIKFKSKKFLKY